MEKLESSCIPR